MLVVNDVGGCVQPVLIASEGPSVGEAIGLVQKSSIRRGVGLVGQSRHVAIAP